MPNKGMSDWRNHSAELATHLAESIENVERLLRFVTKVSRFPNPNQAEAISILQDFGRGPGVIPPGRRENRKGRTEMRSVRDQKNGSDNAGHGTMELCDREQMSGLLGEES